MCITSKIIYTQSRSTHPPSTSGYSLQCPTMLSETALPVLLGEQQKPNNTLPLKTWFPVNRDTCCSINSCIPACSIISCRSDRILPLMVYFFDASDFSVLHNSFGPPPCIIRILRFASCISNLVSQTQSVH